MSDVAFRFAVQADTPVVVDLIERAYRGAANAGAWTSEAHLLTGPRTSHAEISDLIARADTRFLLAERDGQIAGCCLLQGLTGGVAVSGNTKSAYDDSFGASAHPGANAERTTNAAYFGMFAIDPQGHGGGLGKLMIAEAEKRVRELWSANQMVMTVINVRTKLIEWYQRRGYRLTGAGLPFPFSETTGETTRDFHLVEMRKDLP
jgi:ribosomal protein S18 acetylase RimI-like enzyme